MYRNYKPNDCYNKCKNCKILYWNIKGFPKHEKIKKDGVLIYNSLNCDNYNVKFDKKLKTIF